MTLFLWHRNHKKSASQPEQLQPWSFHPDIHEDTTDTAGEGRFLSPGFVSSAESCCEKQLQRQRFVGADIYS